MENLELCFALLIEVTLKFKLAASTGFLVTGGWDKIISSNRWVNTYPYFPLLG
jgi:hypothetical protein